MTLEDILLKIKYGTKVCICDNMGPWNDTCPMEELPARCVLGALDREVEDIYVDPSDMSITIELVNED